MTANTRYSSTRALDDRVRATNMDVTHGVPPSEHVQPRPRTPVVEAKLAHEENCSDSPSDPWPHILATLSESVPDSACDGATRECRSEARRGGIWRSSFRSTQARLSVVTVVERLSQTRVSLSWRDSTLCNYEEQVWTYGKAKSSGRCALSGKPILRGDSVYRLMRRGRDRPLNNGEMILASELAFLVCDGSS